MIHEICDITVQLTIQKLWDRCVAVSGLIGGAYLPGRKWDANSDGRVSRTL